MFAYFFTKNIQMANLKDIRIRISSVNNTKKVTNAMKMVSAAKLKKAQDAITQIRPYADKLQEIILGLNEIINPEENPYGRTKNAEKVLIVAISSNKGLCGAFNANITKQANILASTKYAEQNSKGNLDILAIGKQSCEWIKKTLNVVSEKNDLYPNVNFKNVSEIATEIMNQFIAGDYDRVELVYNKFKNAGVQIITTEQFLPIVHEEDNSTTPSDYIFEPGKQSIIEEIIPKSLKIQFFKAILNSFASEHGARMTAMHKATDNATELVKELTLTYNKARQTAITNEILEIVSGANALSD